MLTRSGIYIHHLLTMDTSKRLPNFLSACDNPSRPGMSMSGGGIGAGFIGVGEDSGKEPISYTQRDGKSDAGYWVNSGDSFIANVVLVNYNKENKVVNVTYDMEWAPKKPSANTKGMLISVTQCPTARTIKMSTSGPTNTTSGKFTFLETGNILAARGHLHGMYSKKRDHSLCLGNGTDELCRWRKRSKHVHQRQVHLPIPRHLRRWRFDYRSQRKRMENHLFHGLL